MLITQQKKRLVICLGDIYWSDNAIKKIIETEVKDTMFFCVRDISDGRPVGVNTKGREPLAYKVVNQEIFRKAINDLFQMIDEGKFKADPISWNLYRQINGIELDLNGYGNDIFNTKGDYKVIDDYTTDIDNIKDVEKLEKMILRAKGGGNMIKVKVKEQFFLGKFNELQNIDRKNPNKKENGFLYVDDTFECTKEMLDYLQGGNATGKTFVEVIEIIPDKKYEVSKGLEESVKNAGGEVIRKPRRKKTTSAKKTIAKED